MPIRTRKTHIRFVKLSMISLAMLTSSSSQACAVEPFISSVCLMALGGAKYVNGFNNTYRPANGQILVTQAYSALYALIGNTYGGNTTSSFNLPNLQGRVVVGTGINATTGKTYAAGASKDNQASVTLSMAQLPAHTHPLSPGTSSILINNGTVSLNFNHVSYTTSLAQVTAATTLANVRGTVNGNNLELMGSNTGNTSNNPLDASLATTTAVSAKIYSDATPTIGRKPGSIFGNAPVSFSGTPTTTLVGNPVTTMTGSPAVIQGATTAFISGSTGSTGDAQAIDIMPSYLAMTYFIAVVGAYPTPD